MSNRCQVWYIRHEEWAGDEVFEVRGWTLADAVKSYAEEADAELALPDGPAWELEASASPSGPWRKFRASASVDVTYRAEEVKP